MKKIKTILEIVLLILQIAAAISVLGGGSSHHPFKLPFSILSKKE